MADSKSKDIKNAIVALVRRVERDGEPAFASVRGYPFGAFDQFPDARLLPEVQDTQKGAYGQNDRTVRFTLRLHNPLLDGPAGETDEQADARHEKEFDDMYELTDLVFDALDDADYAGDIVESLGAEVLNASTGRVTVVEAPGGNLLAADIEVAVTYSRDNE